MTERFLRTAKRTHTFSESVIREMTRVARQYDAINLAQGFPDFPAPELLKEAACAAIRNDVNQYAITWGTANLRHALAEKYGRMYDLDVDPEREITVTCGATEAMAAAGSDSNAAKVPSRWAISALRPLKEGGRMWQ